MLLDVLRVTLLIEPLNEHPAVYYGGGRKYFDVPAMTSDSNEPIWINKELDIEQYYPDRVSFRRDPEATLRSILPTYLVPSITF